jgi:hypothetical protein
MRAASWRGGSAVRPKRWRLAAVVELEVQVLEFQRRRPRSSSCQVMLASRMMTRSCTSSQSAKFLAARLGSDFQPGGEEAALAVAPQLQLRRVEFQARQAQLEMPQASSRTVRPRPRRSPAPGRPSASRISKPSRLSAGRRPAQCASILRMPTGRLIAVPIMRSMSPPVAFDLRQDRRSAGQQQQGEGEVAQRGDPEQTRAAGPSAALDGRGSRRRRERNSR